MDTSEKTVVSRKDAKFKGIKRYFTGKPCKHGHTVERYTVNGKCLICHSNENRVMRQSHPARYAERARKWREKNQEDSRKAQARYRMAHREICIKRASLWRASHPEKQANSKRVWRMTNRDTVSASSRNRRAKLKGAFGRHTKHDIKDLYAAQKGRCAYCKVVVGDKYHVDHIRPLSKGGGNGKDNLQICCPTCNLQKHAKDPDDYGRDRQDIL